MKTKLLRKVRKQYSITKITNVSDGSYMFLCDSSGIPITQDIYIVERKSIFKSYFTISQTYDSAYQKLINYIREDFGNKKITQKSEKVWY